MICRLFDYKEQANLVYEVIQILSKLSESNIFMNISESYSPTELGIENLLRLYPDTTKYLKGSS